MSDLVGNLRNKFSRNEAHTLTCELSWTHPALPVGLILDVSNPVFSLEGAPMSPINRKKHMSRVMRKPMFCICENKDADQLRGNREADQRLCFSYLDSTMPLLPKYKISSL